MIILQNEKEPHGQNQRIKNYENYIGDDEVIKDIINTVFKISVEEKIDSEKVETIFKN